MGATRLYHWIFLVWGVAVSGVVGREQMNWPRKANPRLVKLPLLMRRLCYFVWQSLLP
jgi:hypothetical protein